jgi:hypothetical protein
MPSCATYGPANVKSRHKGDTLGHLFSFIFVYLVVDITIVTNTRKPLLWAYEIDCRDAVRWSDGVSTSISDRPGGCILRMTRIFPTLQATFHALHMASHSRKPLSTALTLVVSVQERPKSGRHTYRRCTWRIPATVSATTIQLKPAGADFSKTNDPCCAKQNGCGSYHIEK